MKDIALNPIFASVAADLGHVPSDHYALADVAPYATPIPAAEITADAERPRNSKGRFVSTSKEAVS